MTLPIKSIFSCLVLLATASDIRTQQIQEVGSADILVKTLDRGIFVGRSLESNHVPIITYTLEESYFKMSVFTQSKKRCNFEFYAGSINDIIVQAARQLNDNTIVVEWYYKLDIESAVVVVFGMDPCARKANIVFKPASYPIEVVPAVNGFDVITSDNFRTSYDINGILIGEREYFPLNSKSFSISAALQATNPKRFFVVDYSNAVLNLVDVNGKLLKEVLKLPAKVLFTNNEQSLYSACWFNNQLVVNCRQYDQDGFEQWRNTETLAFYGKLEVKNVAGGRLVFVASNTNGNQLSFVEMGPKQVNKWSHSPLKQEFGEMRLADFSEDGRTFLLAYDALGTEQGKTEEYVALQKYALLS